MRRERARLGGHLGSVAGRPCPPIAYALRHLSCQARATRRAAVAFPTGCPPRCPGGPAQIRPAADPPVDGGRGMQTPPWMRTSGTARSCRRGGGAPLTCTPASSARSPDSLQRAAAPRPSASPPPPPWASTPPLPGGRRSTPQAMGRRPTTRGRSRDRMARSVTVMARSSRTKFWPRACNAERSKSSSVARGRAPSIGKRARHRGASMDACVEHTAKMPAPRAGRVGYQL